MKNKEFIGIDVSKKTLDVFILSIRFHFTIDNSPAGFARLLEVCFGKVNSKADIFFCFENTGRYSRLLSVFLSENHLPFFMANALDLKKSMGLKRGKSDKKDASTIAAYAWKNRDSIQPTTLQAEHVGQLRQLLGLREKLIKHRTAYKNSISDLQDCFLEGETDFIHQSQLRLIGHLNEELQRVEAQIEQIINSLPEWQVNYKLIQSVRGIGPTLAKYLIIYSENFTAFTDPRKFACFAGIAPFEYSSGTSVKGRTRVHPLANKQLKSLLNIAAMGAIQLDGEYKQYFKRRTDEGKNKMSTLNIIRNKLVFRIFAVVKRGTPYVDLLKFAA
jgi:transposase